VLKKIQDPKARAAIIVPFTPLANSKIGEMAARFDVVLGFTPAG
jgi:protocatechuate 3,4-dioxygenase beta subunit